MMQQRWWQQIWSWPGAGGYGKAHHTGGWEAAVSSPLTRARKEAKAEIQRTEYPPGARPSKWYTSRVPLAHGQHAHPIGGDALRNRVKGLPPKTIRPAFTGPYERKWMRWMIGHNRSHYQPIMMLPVIKRSQPQAVRHSQAPRIRPALVAPRQRYSKIEDDAIMMRARQRAFGGGGGRLGTRAR